MFVQLYCKDRNQKEKDEIYEVLAALCHRENIQIEERGDVVEIDVCTQGKIIVQEVENDVILSANTRHAGPGFHAFCVDFFLDLKEELPGDYELQDELEFEKDGDIHRILHHYMDELEYLRGNLIRHDPIFFKNYLYDSTYFLPLEKPNCIATPIGYVDTKELSHLDPVDLVDIFCIWNQWDIDATYFKNAALTLLAKEGYGPYLHMNEQTEKVAEQICDYIELAYERDHSISLPVKEYRMYANLLQREDKLKDAIPMEQEVFQYRLMEVYHLFENCKVVALGACERSYDPVTQSLCLMSPRTSEEQWDYLIQASKQEVICSHLEQLHQKDAISVGDKSLWMDVFEEDGFLIIEAHICQMEENLYFHCILADPKNEAYLKECIRQSEFANL